MKPVDYIVAIRREGHRIAGVAEAGLGRAVPSCPGWNIAGLLWHVGNVHTFWRQVASGAVAGPDAYQEPGRPSDQTIVQWFRDGVEETAAILDQTEPDTPAWTWGRRKDVGFIRRRVAHETAVHCWDAGGALGSDEPIDRALAVDGVAEFCDDVLPRMSNDLNGPVQTVALRANDVDVQWTISAGRGACQSAQPGATVDATVCATASELLLLLWGRRPVDQVGVEGNVEALQRFLARASF